MKFLFTVALLLILPLTSGAFPPSQGASSSDAAPPATMTGRVVQALKAGRYTYFEIETAKETRWVAAPAIEIAVGESVRFSQGMAMREFPSKTLGRTFELVYFISHVSRLGSPKADAAKAHAPDHPPIKQTFDASQFDFTQLEPVEGGTRIGKIIAAPRTFTGREVTVRALVVKINSSILNRNWIHLRDGSGDAGSNTLVATSDALAVPGDVVVVTGTIATDKDFGAGYTYAVLLENARLAADEPPSLFAPSELRSATGKLIDPETYYPAEECGECHVRQLKQWAGSAHNMGHRDGIYRAFADLAREEGGESLYRFCSSCHTPAAIGTGRVPASHDDDSFLVQEGVTCDACHTVSGVAAVHKGAGANASLILEENDFRYGPFKKAQPDASHETAFAEAHAGSRLCSACHTLIHPHNGLVIENSFEEWKAGPFAAAGIGCKDCHMRTVAQARQTVATMQKLAVPGTTTEDGAPRTNVYAHIFAGANVNTNASGIGLYQAAQARARLQSAATLSLELPATVPSGRAVGITVKVSNVGAGHSIPTSITELREVWLDVSVTDGGGREIFRSGTLDKNGALDDSAVVYRSILLDEKGEVTYLPWRAVSLQSEHLIKAGSTETEPYTIPLPRRIKGPLQVVAVLRYRSAPQNVMDELFGKGRFTIEVVDMARATGTIATE